MKEDAMKEDAMKEDAMKEDAMKEDAMKEDAMGQTSEQAGHAAEQERAATRRLLELMAAHGRADWAAQFAEDFAEDFAGEEARQWFAVASLCAAIHCARFRLRAAGVPWEELRAVFEGGGAQTDRARRAMKQIGRADRLLMRLVLRGVSQGEDASAGRRVQEGH